MKRESVDMQQANKPWVRAAVVSIAVVGAVLQTAVNVLPALLVLFALLSGWAVLGWLLNADPHTAQFREFLIFLQGGMPWALALTILVAGILSVAPFMLSRWITRVRATYTNALGEAESMALGMQRRLQAYRQERNKGK